MLWPVILGSIGTIIVLELSMLHLFERRRVGIEFPRHVDQSFFRFFTVWRFRTVILLHTLFMTAVIGFTLFFLW